MKPHKMRDRPGSLTYILRGKDSIELGVSSFYAVLAGVAAIVLIASGKPTVSWEALGVDRINIDFGALLVGALGALLVCASRSGIRLLNDDEVDGKSVSHPLVTLAKFADDYVAEMGMKAKSVSRWLRSVAHAKHTRQALEPLCLLGLSTGWVLFCVSSVMNTDVSPTVRSIRAYVILAAFLADVASTFSAYFWAAMHYSATSGVSTLSDVVPEGSAKLTYLRAHNSTTVFGQPNYQRFLHALASTAFLFGSFAGSGAMALNDTWSFNSTKLAVGCAGSALVSLDAYAHASMRASFRSTHPLYILPLVGWAMTTVASAMR